MANGLENLKKIDSKERARELQLKSAKKRSQNIKEKKLIREVLEERLKDKDLNIILDNLIERAKDDSKDFEVLQAALGQKPTDKQELEVKDIPKINIVRREDGRD